MSDVQPLAPPPRVVTQIAAAAGDPNVLYALASDGTVWRLAVRLNHTWSQLPPLPADETAPGPADVPSPAI